MKKTFCLFIFFVVLLLGCESKVVVPFIEYSAKFDNSKIEEVDSILVDIAAANGLRIFKKDREQMRILSKGKDAFFTALYLNENPILIVSNVGVPDTISLSALDYGQISKAKLESIAQNFMERTSSRMGILWENSTAM